MISGVSGGVAGTTITDGAMNDFLTSSGSLIITTSAGTGGSGDITVAGDAAITWANSSELRFFADRDFIISGGASITSTGTGDFVVEAFGSLSSDRVVRLPREPGTFRHRKHAWEHFRKLFRHHSRRGPLFPQRAGTFHFSVRAEVMRSPAGIPVSKFSEVQMISTTSGNILVAGTGVSRTCDNFGVSISRTDP